MSKDKVKIKCSLLFNKELAKNKNILSKFVHYLKANGLDPNVILLYTDNRLLIGIYLDFFEVVYNIGIHADRSCFIIYYIDETNPVQLFKSFKGTGFTPYIYKWFAEKEENLTTAINNYSCGITYVINRLVKPF